jgi:hypothetical protein
MFVSYTLLYLSFGKALFLPAVFREKAIQRKLSIYPKTAIKHRKLDSSHNPYIIIGYLSQKKQGQGIKCQQFKV